MGRDRSGSACSDCFERRDREEGSTLDRYSDERQRSRKVDTCAIRVKVNNW